MLVLTPCISFLLQLPRREFLAHSLSLLSTSTSIPLASSASGDGLLVETDDVTVEPLNKRIYRHGTKLSLRSVASTAHSGDGLGPMAIYPDPVLRHIASPVIEFDDPAVDRVVDLLVFGMKTNSTTALQYGIDARIIVLKGAASPDSSGSALVLINPNVLSRSSEDKMVPWIEYCGDIIITLGNNDDIMEEAPLEVQLLRDEVVEVAAQDIRGLPIRKALRGEAARAFQHELDHLDGLLIIDHAGLDELPKSIARQEAPYHAARQRRAYERRIYQGNGPLYW